MFNQPFPSLYMLGMQVQWSVSFIFTICSSIKVIFVLYYLGASNVREVHAYNTVYPSQVQHLLDRQGEGYDQAVLECQDQLDDSLKLTQVYALFVTLKLIFTLFHP